MTPIFPKSIHGTSIIYIRSRISILARNQYPTSYIQYQTSARATAGARARATARARAGIYIV